MLNYKKTSLYATFFDGLSVDCVILTDDAMDKFVKGFLTLFVVFEHCGGVENFLASVVDIIGYCVFRFFFRARRAVVYDELGYHAEVLV